ncbi:HNH endonuclease [Acinetobacter seifertii]|uniref:HNH endonuclease n=1 Tax=Acinetobacter seifertii TaxID=1530123 RepID=UPI00168D3CA9|nr:hypothetical protein [Acinetobacter seifertii]QNX28932.1 hypothetical protein IC790_10400 [Acinetobacter seifertii]QNY26241.1 hypothetical protein IC763_11975 [Acinetobacter seifertii]
MKLPNFYQDQHLITLKMSMGIPQDAYGTLDAGKLDYFNLTKVASPEGLELKDLSQIEQLDDNTLAIAGQRILLYIRDTTNFEPKFHFSNCQTLQKMRESNRIGRYVATNCETGNFLINYIKDNKPQACTKRLKVCRYCLDFLAWQGYSHTVWSEVKKSRAVEHFNISDFFKVYPKSFHPHNHQDSIHAPLNIYPKDWRNISSSVREKSGWNCIQCQINLSAVEHHRFLHVHHKNGQKHNNNRENLEVLCIRCHSNEPNHQHLKFSKTYQDFIKFFDIT